MCAFVLFWVSFPDAWTPFGALSVFGRGSGLYISNKINTNSNLVNKNIHATVKAQYFGCIKTLVHGQLWFIPGVIMYWFFFLVDLWCSHKTLHTTFSNGLILAFNLCPLAQRRYWLRYFEHKIHVSKSCSLVHVSPHLSKFEVEEFFPRKCVFRGIYVPVVLICACAELEIPWINMFYRREH